MNKIAWTCVTDNAPDESNNGYWIVEDANGCAIHWRNRTGSESIKMQHRVGSLDAALQQFGGKFIGRRRLDARCSHGECWDGLHVLDARIAAAAHKYQEREARRQDEQDHARFLANERIDRIIAARQNRRNALCDAYVAAKPKFKKSTVSIPLNDGTVKNITGYAIGGLLAHNSLRAGYDVTHIASGLRITSDALGRLVHAKNAVWLLNRIGVDWTQDGQSVKEQVGKVGVHKVTWALKDAELLG